MTIRTRKQAEEERKKRKEAERRAEESAKARGTTTEQQKQRGQEFISAREKALARGASKEEASRLAAEKGGQPQRTVEEVNQLQKRTQENLAELGAFEEVGQARELKVEENAEGLPLVDKLVGAISPELQTNFNAVRNRNILNSIDLTKIQDMNLEEFRSNPEIISEPYLLELIKTETDLEVLKSGEATASQLGSLTEGIGVSTLVKYVPGITTPSESVKALVEELTIIESDLREQGRLADQGNIDPYTALRNAERYEEEILVLESKLRFMISQSAELKNYPEGVNSINQKIQGIYNTINATRGRAGQGLLQRTIINPDQAYLEFQRMKAKGGKNEKV